ncbi:MAG: HAMP domain-containing histidine kinase [Hydrogenophilaceae bacterium]|nr:HAMP domain-containing histidine kinase [Hydrogenophilaceae bacterium]
MPVPAEETPSEELKEAFALFSETSAKLSEAYEELQSQVARLSAELATANGELARRERLSALGEMAAKLAHQFRTPLAAALLYVGHLARPGLADADRIRFAEKTLSRLRYLERLIQDMLSFVKGQQGEPTAISVQGLVEELEQVIEPQATLQGVEIEATAPAAPLLVWVDRPAVLGALINLMENALQASPVGSRIRLQADSHSSPFVAFRVEDEGPGIPEETKARLFEPFFTTRGEGSGLGLAIVKQTADAYGGWVEVESVAGRGSAFTLFLPLYKEAGAA